MNTSVLVVGRRACASVAACSAVLHAITTTHTHTAAAAVVMAAMAIACLYCACDLWAKDALRTWVWVAVMNLAMIALHAPGGSGHQHGGRSAAAVTSIPPSTVMTAATALAVMEAAIATAVVYQRSRHNRLVVARAGAV